jgi:hypothetical protein
MSDWHTIFDEQAPEWILEDQIIFVRETHFCGAGDEYGPIKAGMVNWAAVSQFRFAESLVSYK